MIADFDPAELPAGRMLIEASAGTGKTHALTGLAVHLLGRGEVRVDELLVVTYTRLATAELRGRIRATIAGVLAEFDQDAPDPGLAPVVDALRGWNPEVARSNLRDALAVYDALTVTTIHGFAQRALLAHGALAGLDPDFDVLADSSRLVTETGHDELAMAAQQAHDLIRGGALDADAVAELAGLLPASPTPVIETANMVDETLDLLVLPEISDTDPSTLAAILGDDEPDTALVTSFLVHRVARTVAGRRLQAGLRSYGELLTGLHGALDGTAGPALQKRLGEQFRVALIDEFQDTDRVQWEIFDRCFGHDGGRLILVGDPKQAIYGFRGANIHTYTSAAAGAGMERRKLPTNWRSDHAVLEGLATLWNGAVFGEGIAFVPVQAAPDHGGSRLRRDDGAVTAPVEIAVADTDRFDEGTSDGKKPLKADFATKVIAHYVVDHVVDLLDHVQLAEGVDEPGSRAIEPGDIALLVRSRAEGHVLAEALVAANVPVVVHDSGDVRVATGPGWRSSAEPSRAADEWRLVLEAVADPADPRRARAAATGLFGPLDAPTDLVDANEEKVAAFQAQLGDWAATLAASGPAVFCGRLWAESTVVARVLGELDGDRLMTDLEHLGELFVTELGTGPVAPERLLGLLEPPADDQEDGADRITQRRIPTGEPAVTIMTVHKSKGLQFPIVGCIGLHKLSPQGADRSFDPDSGRQVIDLARGDEFKDGAKREQREENLRLLYVGLTRARHHVFTCWAREQNSPRAALTRVLYARNDHGDIEPDAFLAETVTIPGPGAAGKRVEDLAGRSEGSLGVRILDQDLLDASPSRWAGPSGAARREEDDRNEDPTPALEAARLERRLDRRRGRWSFTAITSQGDPGRADADPVVQGGDDEAQSTAPPPAPPLDEAERASSVAVSPLAWLPAGPAFGTLVHAVLEDVDFTSGTVEDDLRRALVAQQTVRRIPLRPTGADEAVTASGEDLCVAGLAEALRAPLGPLWNGRRLADLGPEDRLNECTFDLRLDAPVTRPVTPTGISELVLEHLEPDDPYRDWAERLAGGRYRVDLAGHLTGSIDLVARIREGDGDRFVISDYKTNRLHTPGTPPADDDYGPDALVRAMEAHEYPLQALLYSVALHRYLRWRLPGYDPAHHLGGVTYLFLRGMTASATDGGASGVASWKLPPSLIEALDARFGGREAG